MQRARVIARGGKAAAAAAQRGKRAAKMDTQLQLKLTSRGRQAARLPLVSSSRCAAQARVQLCAVAGEATRCCSARAWDEAQAGGWLHEAQGERATR